MWVSASVCGTWKSTASFHPATLLYVPVELCLSFSFFFFLHFHGLKIRPRVASLLFRRMGGVWTPVTRQPVLSTLCWSTTSTTETVEMEEEDETPREGPRVVTGGWSEVRKQRGGWCRQEKGQKKWEGVCGGMKKNHQTCKCRWRAGDRRGGKAEHN